MKDYFKFTEIQIPFTSTKFEQNLEELGKENQKELAVMGVIIFLNSADFMLF